VSVSTSGQPADGSSGQASISADGSHVAFESSATNLGAQGMVMSGVYVRDLAAGTTTFASRADGTAGAADTYATGTALSADGTKLSFMASTSLDPKDTNGTSDIYVRDLAHATTTLVSRADGANTNAGNASSLASMINGDGTRVAFVSAASDLGDGDPNNAYDVHLRDLSANTTILVDRADGANGAIADSNTFGVSIDRSGNRVAFDSTASNLATGVPSFSTQVYVRDVAAGTTQLVSHAGSSGAPADDYAYQSRISSDGHQVAFQASGTNLQPPDATHVSGVFLRDLDAQTLQLVSRADGAAGAPATAAANPTLDADGSCVAFTSNDPLTSPGYASHDFSHVYLRVVSRECPLIAPDTTIDSGPTGALSSPSRAITFSSSEAGSTFACKLDGQPYATCSSPYTTPVAGQGAHTFSVRATDKAQLTDPTPATADFTVGPPAAGGAKPPGGGGKDTTAPVVRGLAITPRSFAVAAGTTALAAAKHARRGTTITYTLSERASTTLTISRTLPGRRKGKRCVAAGKAPKHAKRCTRSVVVATLTRTAATGKRRVPFTGRVGKRKLARGSYELIVRARDAAGNVSAPARTTFKVRSR
jgi:Tol biopolymer transport system component